MKHDKRYGLLLLAAVIDEKLFAEGNQNGLKNALLKNALGFNCCLPHASPVVDLEQFKDLDAFFGDLPTVPDRKEFAKQKKS